MGAGGPDPIAGRAGDPAGIAERAEDPIDIAERAGDPIEIADRAGDPIDIADRAGDPVVVPRRAGEPVLEADPTSVGKFKSPLVIISRRLTHTATACSHAISSNGGALVNSSLYSVVRAYSPTARNARPKSVVLGLMRSMRS